MACIVSVWGRSDAGDDRDVALSSWTSLGWLVQVCMWEGRIWKSVDALAEGLMEHSKNMRLPVNTLAANLITLSACMEKGFMLTMYLRMV